MGKGIAAKIVTVLAGRMFIGQGFPDKQGQ
jgi:hypothetical protein